MAIVDFDPDIITANLGSILGVLRIRWFVQKQATLVSESSFVEIVLIFASYERIGKGIGFAIEINQGKTVHTGSDVNQHRLLELSVQTRLCLEQTDVRDRSIGNSQSYPRVRGCRNDRQIGRRNNKVNRMGWKRLGILEPTHGLYQDNGGSGVRQVDHVDQSVCSQIDRAGESEGAAATDTCQNTV